MAITRSKNQAKRSEQYIQNASYDEDFDVLAFEVLEYDGTSLNRKVSGTSAVKITESGDITYVAKAAIGASQSSAVWQAMKINETTGLVITWADGNANFDNTATDLTALTYS